MSELPKAVRKNGGVDVTGRRRVNLVEGTHITLTVADDPTNSETDVTIAASDDTIVVRKNSGSDVGTRARLNFIEGTNITLTVADDPGDGEIDITVATSPVTGFASADYIVTDIGGSPGVINGHTGATLGTYASYSAAVNAALGATAGACVIWLDPAYVDNETGTITISKKNVTIYSGLHKAMESGSDWFTTHGQPAFQKITIDTTSTEVRNIMLQGINMCELNFNTVTNSMSNIVVNNCGFRPSTATSTKGIHFSGNAMVNYVEFNDCWIFDECTTGGILYEITANVGCGQYFFNRLHYKAGVTNCEMMVCGVSSRIDQATVFDQLDHVNISRTGHSWFHFKDGSKQLNLRVVNSRGEEHISANIFKIDSGHTSATQRRWIDFSHNMFSLGDDNGQTLTFIANSAVNADYAGYSQNFLMGHQNKFVSDSASTGVFALGTTGATTRFIWDLGYTYYRDTTEVNVVGTKG